MDKPGIREPKKPYSYPILKIYGTVQELTRKVGNQGGPDGNKNPHGPTRTQV